MCLPNTIDQLRVALKEVEQSKEQLANAQEALMHSEKLASMGQLAAGIAHEVNNPLGVVLMYAHLLLDESSPDAETREDLQLIAEQADRCKKIVAGLLHFARQNRVIRAEANVCEMVDRLLKVFQIPKNVSLRVSHALDDPVARIDRDQLGQVLTNLVSNAIGAMPGGGELIVETAGDSDKVSISVTDTGYGIPEENRQKIFEPFFTTKHIGKGTGLGLAVSYGIVKMHRGDIEVESNADPEIGPTGTTFRLVLPRDVEDETRGGSDRAAGNRGRRRMSDMDQLRVLVVDDEPGMRRGVSRTLRNFTVNVPNVEQTVRFEIDEAESGEGGAGEDRGIAAGYHASRSQDAGDQRARRTASRGRHEIGHPDRDDHGLCVDRNGWSQPRSRVRTIFWRSRSHPTSCGTRFGKRRFGLPLPGRHANLPTSGARFVFSSFACWDTS